MNLHNPIVFGLLPGGIPVACEVASALQAPLDLAVVGNLSAPESRRIQVGALAPDGSCAFDDRLVPYLGGLEGQELSSAIKVARRDAMQREQRYRHNRPQANLGHRDVILVSDGMDTGISMLAAATAMRHRGPAHLFIAVPATSRIATRRLAAIADDIICLDEADQFLGIGCYYMDFAPVTDEDACRQLDEACRNSRMRPVAAPWTH